MSNYLSLSPIQKFFTNDGKPLAGGLLYTYAAGTSTPQGTFKDSVGTVNTNPIVLDFRGECALWLDPSLSYKYLLTDSLGNQISGYPVDNIHAVSVNPLLVAVRSATLPIVSNTVLTLDPLLNIPVVPPGIYAFDGYLCFNESVASTGGFQFDMGGGSATVGINTFVATGLSNVVFSSQATNFGFGEFVSMATIIVSPLASSLILHGIVGITIAGSIGMRVAQVNSSVNATNLFNSYISLNKIG